MSENSRVGTNKQTNKQTNTLNFNEQELRQITKLISIGQTVT